MERRLTAKARRRSSRVQRYDAPRIGSITTLLCPQHYEMASVNAVVRTIIHMPCGTALMAESYPEAAASFERAGGLRPDLLVHRVELARSCLKLGQQQQAREELGG